MNSEAYTDDRRVYEVDNGELHWFVATSPQEALEHFIRYTDYDSLSEYLSEVGQAPQVTELPWDREINICDEDEGTDITARARDWARQDEGFLATTDF